MGRKRKFSANIGEEEQEKPAEESKVNTFSLGSNIGSKRGSDKRLIVVLERANLESVKNGKSYELMNCDDHLNLIRKFKKDPALYRPDILHQCLLMLQDSPLNQMGLLQVYIHTEKNVLIQIHPQCRIPRTFKRFAGVMVQLLHRLSVRADKEGTKLLKVIKNPIEDHLPAGCRKIGTSFSSTKLVQPRDLVPSDEPMVIVVGAMAHGKVEVGYVEEEISLSKCHLSAALACAKICSAFEEVWGVQ